MPRKFLKKDVKTFQKKLNEGYSGTVPTNIKTVDIKQAVNKMLKKRFGKKFVPVSHVYRKGSKSGYGSMPDFWGVRMENGVKGWMSPSTGRLWAKYSSVDVLRKLDTMAVDNNLSRPLADGTKEEVNTYSELLGDKWDAMSSDQKMRFSKYLSEEDWDATFGPIYDKDTDKANEMENIYQRFSDKMDDILAGGE